MLMRFFREPQRRWLGLLFVSCAIQSLAVGSSFPGANRKWHRYESPHFELFSQESERKSRDLLRDIEALHAFMRAKLDLEVRRPAPVTIYFFGSEKDYESYLPPSMSFSLPEGEKSLGQYLVYPDRDVIMLSPFDGEMTALWVVQSNLALHLLLGHAGRSPPAWLGSGVSLLFGTFAVKKDKVEWGRADNYRQTLVRKFPQVSLEHVFHGGDRPFLPGMVATDYQDLPQAHAWGVLHYWYFGQSEVPVAAVNEFIHGMLQQGMPRQPERMRQRIRETFGVDYPEMESRIARYLKAGKFKSRTESLDGVPARESFAMRLMSESENNRVLAELVFRTRSDPVGRYHLLQAAEAKDARAYEALGAAEFRPYQANSANESWRRAVDLGSANPALLRQVALAEWSRWFTQLNVDYRLPEEAAEHLRSRLKRWIEVLPDQSEPYEALVWVEASAPEPKIEHVNLVQSRFSRLERPVPALLALARIRVRLEDFPAAEQILADLEKFEPNAGERALAEALKSLIRRNAERIKASP